MKKEEIIVSIDGGGTNTRVVLSVNQRRVFKQFNFGVNYKKCQNVAESFRELANYIDEVVGIQEVDRFVFGLAGIDLDPQKDIDVYKKIISSVLKINGFDEKVKILNDIYLVNGLLPNNDEDRIIVICATGSNVLYRSGNQIDTNTDSGYHSLGGTRHIVEHFINHVPLEECPYDLKDLVSKYKGTDFDKDQLEVIDHFKKASYTLLNNIENKYCKEACLFGINSMIDGIKMHIQGKNSRPAIYLYGGQFKSKDYKELFIETLKDRNIKYTQVNNIETEAAYGGLHL